jgi:hypothetical protein
LLALVRIVLLSAHLIAVNVAAGSPLICIWLEWRRGAVWCDATRFLASVSLLGLLTGGLFGLIIGVIEWNDHYANVWGNLLWHKVFFAVLELLFSAALLTVYWIWTKRADPPGWLSAIRSLLLLVAATNLIYHFPPLFFVGQRLIDQPAEEGPLSSADFRASMYSGETPALIVHFGLASIAVAGLALAHLALRWRRLGRVDEADAVAVAGGRWALVPTLLQLPVGLWVLVSLPRPMQNELLGTSVLGLIVFGGALLSALWLSRELVSLAMGETDRGPLLRSMIAMLVTIVLMTTSHDLARSRRQASSAVVTTSSAESMLR